jgi:SH3 domain-containing YSC84-like protein 1
MSPTGGNGVIVARLPDGSWSPPAAIEVASLGLLGLGTGLDLVEAVMVLPTAQAVENFKDSFLISLGYGAGYSLGPWGRGLGADLISNRSVYTDMPRIYARSRGLMLIMSVDAKYVGPRRAADELFYGKKGLTTNQILKGNVPEKGPAGMWYVISLFTTL